MTDTVTLKPCPFCGGNDVTPVCVYHPNGYAIGCPKCRAKGPTYKASRASDLPADAITAWNTRDGGAATPMREAASSVGADALAHLESEARRFAGFYEPNSDMANTLNILGNKIAALALSTAQEVDETERLRERVAAAYVAGAMDVHNHWLDNPGEAPRGDPEFGEAASDYARASLSLAKGGE